MPVTVAVDPLMCYPAPNKPAYSNRVYSIQAIRACDRAKSNAGVLLRWNEVVQLAPTAWRAAQPADGCGLRGETEWSVQHGKQRSCQYEAVGRFRDHCARQRVNSAV